MATTKVKHYVLDEAEHDPNDPNPWIVGYARMSDGEHVDAPEVQAMKIRERSETIKGRYVGTWVDGGISGRGVPYDKRPGFVDCLAVVRKGDHLVVNKLDRLERGGLLRMARCLGAIADKDVYLHSVQEYGGERLDFSKLEMQPVIFMLAWAAEFYSQQQIETLRATREWRRKNGYAICRRQFGKRTEIRPDPAPGRKGKTVKLHVWNEK
ncbi:MAG: recombinase family protein, partial [Planctomycetota bacterium]